MCCGSIDTIEEGKKPAHLVQPVGETSNAQPLEHPPEPSWQLPSHAIGHPEFRIVRCIKYNHEFKVEEARLTPDGKPHRIAVRFDENDQKKMTLFIDDKLLHTVNTKWNFRGSTWLIIDNSPVFFLWDVYLKIKKFTFRTTIKNGKRGESSGETESSAWRGTSGEAESSAWPGTSVDDWLENSGVSESRRWREGSGVPDSSGYRESSSGPGYSGWRESSGGCEGSGGDVNIDVGINDDGGFEGNEYTDEWDPDVHGGQSEEQFEWLQIIGM